MEWILGLALFLLGCWTVASMMAVSGVEQTPYTVAGTENGFELRNYPELTIAETIAGEPGRQSDGEAFQRLARYIFGANEGGAKLAMTAPVFIDDTTGRTRMSFVLPAGVGAPDAPVPKSEAVSVKAVPGQLVAAVRFSWFAPRSRREAIAKDMAERLEAAGLAAAGPAVYAAYHPPFAAPFLKRHEILIPVRRN